MKKLCFIINHISSGAGTERVAINIINGLAERGHDITLVTLWNSGESFFELNERVRTISLFEEKLPLYRNYLKLVLAIRRFLKDGNFDIVVNIETMLTLLVSPAVRGLGIAHVNWEHYNFTASSDSMLRPVARYVAAWTATAVVTLTEADTRMWQNRTRPRARMKTINNPLPFRKPDYHYHPDSRVVLAVGRLFHQKGFDLLLQTWHQVIGKHPDWTLQIVGSGEEEQALKAQARELTIEDSVEFHPHTKNIEAFL
ncbi:glycosyltransferase [Kushneria phosphatilytica]|uniref:glycosyltransferase n=1 Tax=Kushneria phosphatilytica TaxID=657387 RepID=UPI0008D9E142|nr:glycosyltransferase [Kushneria phosphatilytica]OHV09333.1 hypothetical protein BH688_11080 [Kushneria phosphatilytica]